LHENLAVQIQTRGKKKTKVGPSVDCAKSLSWIMFRVKLMFRFGAEAKPKHLTLILHGSVTLNPYNWF